MNSEIILSLSLFLVESEEIFLFPNMKNNKKCIMAMIQLKARLNNRRKFVFTQTKINTKNRERTIFKEEFVWNLDDETSNIKIK